MLRIEIPTDALSNADDVEPGPALAVLLRQIAERIESDIRILPGRSGEWIPEVYRDAQRVSGVLLGAVTTLEVDN